MNPNFRAYSVRASTPKRRPYAFALVTGLWPPNLMTAKTEAAFDTPTGYIKRASDRRFRWSEALSRHRVGPWWQRLRAAPGSG
jgi:hypothetical protein